MVTMCISLSKWGDLYCVYQHWPYILTGCYLFLLFIADYYLLLYLMWKYGITLFWMTCTCFKLVVQNKSFLFFKVSRYSLNIVTKFLFRSSCSITLKYFWWGTRIYQNKWTADPIISYLTYPSDIHLLRWRFHDKLSESCWEFKSVSAVMDAIHPMWKGNQLIQ